MSARGRFALRALVIVGGVAATVAGALALRLEDWPIYVVFLALSFLLYAPAVEVVPGLALPMPSLALTIGFVYVGGLPIVFLRNLAPPTGTQLVRFLLPERWHHHLPDRFWATQYFGARRFRSVPRSAVGAEWAMFSIGLGVRWWVVSRLVPHGVPARYPEAVLVAEMAGYLIWTLLSFMPILSFSDVLFARPEGRLRTVHVDLSLIMILGLTPFVFLITYGYAGHGLAGAAAWSLAGLGLHFILKRLNERRVTVEEQNRRLEALNRELEHRERLSAIGKMSSVVSHQMLQQLGLIGLHADLLRHAVASGDPTATVAQAKRSGEAIEDALGGVNRVLRDLLVFSRDLRVNLYDHALAGLLAECVEECGHQAAERGVTLSLECPPEASVTLDKLKVKQALANVLRNAIEASPKGSEVLLRADVRDGWAEIAVIDRGPGVPERNRDAIFTPFFTTKEEGTGLGLAIARAFVEAHGGRIMMESREHSGATFVLRLPQQGRTPSG